MNVECRQRWRCSFTQVVGQTFSQAERIQQCLGWMFIRAIACIDNGYVNLEAKNDAPQGEVSHHHHVHLHREDVVDRVHESLPFLHGGTGRRRIDHVCRESFSASSNERRVRVEFSKNKLATVKSRREGTFLMGRFNTSLNSFAVA